MSDQMDWETIESQECNEVVSFLSIHAEAYKNKFLIYEACKAKFANVLHRSPNKFRYYRENILRSPSILDQSVRSYRTYDLPHPIEFDATNTSIIDLSAYGDCGCEIGADLNSPLQSIASNHDSTSSDDGQVSDVTNESAFMMPDLLLYKTKVLDMKSPGSSMSGFESFDEGFSSSNSSVKFVTCKFADLSLEEINFLQLESTYQVYNRQDSVSSISMADGENFIVMDKLSCHFSCIISMRCLKRRQEKLMSDSKDDEPECKRRCLE